MGLRNAKDPALVTPGQARGQSMKVLNVLLKITIGKYG
jgi:hypothetical protein